MIFNMCAGANPLNFTVLGGLSAPANPKENTVWLSCDAEITTWVFAPTEPENPVEGMAWIKTGLASKQSFNALKDKEITLCPLSASVYGGGAWQSVGAKIFKGQWLSWWNGQLYEYGESFPHITGGWLAVKQKYDIDLNSSNISLTEKESSLLLSVPALEYGYANCGAMMTVNKIDLTDVSSLSVTGHCSKTHAMNRLYVTQNNATTWYSKNAPAAIQLVAEGETVLDVSALTGSYYVALSMYGTTGVSFEMTSCVMN